MDRSKFAMVILLLLSVIIIFISPAVDLQPTALRSVQLANMLFAVLALAGTALAACFSGPTLPVAEALEHASALVPAQDLVDLNCTRLC
jgi:hypothetical protein